MISLVLDRVRDICYKYPTMNEDIIAVQNTRSTLMAKIRDLESSVRREVGYLKMYKKPGYISDGVRQNELIAECETRCAQLNMEIGLKRDQLAPLDAQRVSLDVLPHADLLKFFDGNNADAARNALELYAASKLMGFWIPGASRRVRGALSYMKIKAPRVARGLDKRPAYEEARAIYKAACAEITAQMETWDRTRPAPTFTRMGASPTVSANMKLLDAVSVDVCKIKWEYVEVMNPETKKLEIHAVGVLMWPEGCLHNQSKHSMHNGQCESCGHAIRNSFNWVPLVLTCHNGSKKSLWVGRDCAKTLFGIDMTGDLEILGPAVKP